MNVALTFCKHVGYLVRFVSSSVSMFFCDLDCFYIEFDTEVFHIPFYGFKLFLLRFPHARLQNELIEVYLSIFSVFSHMVIEGSRFKRHVYLLLLLTLSSLAWT